MAVAQITDLAFSYRNTPLFSDLSFTLEEGNIYGLLGKNGAGKTTLLKLLCGQLFADEGNLSLLGQNPTQRTPKLLEEIFFLNEEFILPRMKSAAYLSTYAPFYPRFDHLLFEEIATQFELDLNVRLDQMSLGQKKKYLLSFGLASKTRLLIADEPTNGLDIPSKRQFRQIVASALSEDRTFIISTHQVRDMEGLIDPIIILDEGRVIFNGALDPITDEWVMETTPTEPTEASPYTEKVLGGYLVLKKRSESINGARLDLETIFNVLVEKGGVL